MIIGEGMHGYVIDNCDGTVSKVTEESTEAAIALKLKDVTLKYISNYLGEVDSETSFIGITYYCMIKEKLTQDPKLEDRIEGLSELWDESLVQSNNMFDYINQYLASNVTVKFDCMHATITFHRYLYASKQKRLPLFLDLVDLVQELKDYGIYHVDWNEANFGLRNNHLALFELGGAKIKE